MRYEELKARDRQVALEVLEVLQRYPIGINERQVQGVLPQYSLGAVGGGLLKLVDEGLAREVWVQGEPRYFYPV